MKRVNTFEVVPQTESDKECLLRLLDSSTSLWNELTYERRQNYFGDGDVWDTSEYRGRYNGVVGSATVQQVTLPTIPLYCPRYSEVSHTSPSPK